MVGIQRGRHDKDLQIGAQGLLGLEAEGEAAYMQMLAEAYNTPDKQDFYRFILALDALKASLTGDNKTVILDADSDLAKILMGAGG